MLGALAKHLSVRGIVVAAVLILAASQYAMSYITDSEVRLRVSVSAAIVSTAIDVAAVLYCYRSGGKDKSD